MNPAAPRATDAQPPSPSVGTTRTATTVVVVVGVVLAVLGAYHYTLSTLVSGLTLDTPLAYVGLVPLLALGLAVVLLRRPHDDHDIHDRQVDLLVGLPLLGLALAGVVLLPERLGNEFWLWRLDILLLPLFAAGLVGLLLGTRMLWRLRVPLLFLLAAWPLPWTALLERVEQPLLDATTSAVRWVTSVTGLASPYGETAYGMFEVPSGAGSFLVTVASACAGANSIFGFLLLGSAALLVSRGPRRRKLWWLASGVLLAWGFNVLRIAILLLVGRLFGKEMAIDVVHPVLGTVLFAVVGALMVLLMPRFGLSLQAPPGLRDREPAQRVGLGASSAWARAALVVAVGGSTVVMGTANGALSRNEQILSPFGQSHVTAFSAAPAQLRGWHIGDAGRYPDAARYFGDGATWKRLLYHSTQTVAGSRLGGLPVTIDVIDTGSRRALRAFSVEACYAFHRFDVSSRSGVELGAGVEGDLITYYNKRDKRNWSTLSWEWPVRNGSSNGYERVSLVMVDVQGVPVPGVDGKPVPGSERARTPVRLAAQREFLHAFARDLVKASLTPIETRTA